MMIPRTAAAVLPLLILCFRLELSAGEGRRLGAPDHETFSASHQKKQTRRQLEIQVSTKGNNGSPSASFPLQKCQGDCDNDDECTGSLICFLRSSNEPVPGCTGFSSDLDGIDYCYDPTDITAPSPGSLTVVGNNGAPQSVFPLAKCEGDCDSDSECEGNLKCFQRDDGDSRAVPGCDGDAVGTGSTDYCYDPADDNSTPSPTLPGPSPTPPSPTGGKLTQPGNDQRPSNAFPLGLCEGDCDGDTDCEGDLVCHQRNGREPVPSCSGQGDSNIDYCIDPSDESARPPVKGAFRLKMYWESGYNWQERSWEAEWCMECDGTSCGVNDKILIRTCNDDNTWFLFENLDGDETQLKIATTNFCLEWVGSGEDIRVRACDSSEDRQKFQDGIGSFDGNRFELVTASSRSGCVSQRHHPKDAELLYRENCDTARRDDTTYWIKY